MAFMRGIIVNEHDQRDTELLGDNTKQFKFEDLTKLVKYNGIQCDLAADGDEFVGVIESVEPYTEQGHSVGTVKKTGRVKAMVDSAQVGNLAVGDLVVCGTQAALGTAGAGIVKGGAPVTFKWMVVWLLGDGSADTEIVIERV